MRQPNYIQPPDKLAQPKKLPKPWKPCPLKDCLYYCGNPSQPEAPHCNYIITMMDRHAEVCRRGCPPGKDCIRYVKVGSTEAAKVQDELKRHGSAIVTAHQKNGAMPAMKLSVPMPRKISRMREEPRKPERHFRFDVEVARRLHDSGMNDVEIAAELRVARQQIRYWRQTQGLKANAGTPELGNRIVELHSQGMSSAAIAREAGCAVNTVYTHLARHGLSSNGDPKHPGKAKDK